MVQISGQRITFYQNRTYRKRWRRSESPTDLCAVMFVSGRVATQTDGKRGSASFVATPGTTRPASIHIPQYAMYAGESPPMRPVIVIQAEELVNGSGTLIGFVDLSQDVGLAPLAFNACILSELTLTGTKDPRASDEVVQDDQDS